MLEVVPRGSVRCILKARTSLKNKFNTVFYGIILVDQSTKLSTAQGPSATLHGPELLFLVASPDRLLVEGAGSANPVDSTTNLEKFGILPRSSSL